jgi:stage V sporulation protein B
MSKFNSAIKNQKSEIEGVIRKVVKRDFSGNTGLAIKNSLFQLFSAFVSQIGTLLFTIIIARILLPELFGLYSLALSTIVLFATFSDMSTGTALIKFISSALGRKQLSKAKAYFNYFLKIRIWLTIIVSLILLVSAQFIAKDYYNKPLFLALIAGCLYIFFNSLVFFADSLFKSTNNFRLVFYKEIFFQVTKLILVPLAVLLTLKNVHSQEINVFVMILALALSQLLALIFFIFNSKKISFLNYPRKEISGEEKRKINKFILPLSATALSGIFFGYIDIVMLGRFVSVEFIGYYRAAFSLVGAIVPLIAFSTVLFPILGRLKGKKLEEGFNKSFRITLITSIFMLLFIVFASPLVIKLIFGKEYLTAIPILQVLSLVIISTPLIDLYTTYMTIRGNTKLIAKFLVASTIINIILNYLFITWFLHYSQFMAVIGAAIATILSRYLLLIGLIMFRKH